MTHGYEFFEYDYLDLDLDFDWDDFIGDYEQSEISEEWAEIQDVYDDIWSDLEW